MRLLDLFCGAGGAAMGYSQAGFTEIVGVDIMPQPNYPFEFHQMDVFDWDKWAWFDLIHASPPCQAYSTASPTVHSHPDRYADTRALLDEVGAPYVIENVIGAPYHHGITLCGSMFGLEEEGEWVRRHRNFETSWLMFQPPHDHPAGLTPLVVSGHAFISEARQTAGGRRQGPFDLACRLMGVDWMTRRELVQAIPPAYTKFIGEAFIAQLVREGK